MEKPIKYQKLRITNNSTVAEATKVTITTDFYWFLFSQHLGRIGQDLSLVCPLPCLLKLNFLSITDNQQYLECFKDRVLDICEKLRFIECLSSHFLHFPRDPGMPLFRDSSSGFSHFFDT